MCDSILLAWLRNWDLSASTSGSRSARSTCLNCVAIVQLHFAIQNNNEFVRSQRLFPNCLTGCDSGKAPHLDVLHDLGSQWQRHPAGQNIWPQHSSASEKAAKRRQLLRPTGTMLTALWLQDLFESPCKLCRIHFCRGWCAIDICGT